MPPGMRARIRGLSMPRSGTARLARLSTGWVLLVLCTALIVWRIDFRVGQCRPSSFGNTGAVAFFDANERNLATLDETQLALGWRSVAEQQSSLGHSAHPPLRAACAAKPVLSRLEKPPALRDIFPHSISLFPNPPPPLS